MRLAKFLLFSNWRYVPQIQRNASNYQRSQMKYKTNDYLNTLKTNYFENRTELTMTEWQNVRNCLVTNNKHINKDNVDSMIVAGCTEAHQLPLAKNYIEFLIESGIQPNDATLGKLLRLYNIVYHSRGGGINSMSECEQEEILYICEVLKQKHDVLDLTLCENLIFGLVATPKWRDALELLKMMKLSNALSASAYSELVTKAFGVQDASLGWSLLTEMLRHQKIPKCDVFISLLDSIAQNAKTFPQDFENFLKLVQQYEITITKDVAQHIVEIANKYPKFLSIKQIKLMSSGKCNNCAERMQPVTLNEGDFQNLQNMFLTKTLIGKDVFEKSTPEEVQRFKNYIDQTKPYDCVIDGLNVAYSMGNKKSIQSCAALLCNVVKYFVQKKMCVLVIGREHMSKWPKRNMQYIYDNAFVFLTSDLSQDDPFLLFAALISGQKTDFCSRDLMRQHAHLLGGELKHVFQRWQQEHQYAVMTKTKNGKILIKAPIRYSLCAQKVNETWHLPYKDVYCPSPINTFEIPEHWLCVKMNKI